jgi:hypothetical protein
MATIERSNYDYKLLPNDFSSTEISTYKQSLNEQFAKLTKDWNDKLHSEWTARIFLSSKMIYSSTLMLNSLEFAQSKNIRVTEPYLLYYSLLNCCRALTFTLPTQLWNNAELLIDTHSKIANVTSDLIKRLNEKRGSDILKLVTNARDYREFFSYNFPANGLKGEPQFSDLNVENITKACQLISEIAQFNSECLEKSFNKKASSKNYELDEEILKYCFTYSGDNLNITDDGDTERVAYIFRKVKKIQNIQDTMTTGRSEDFFGSWTVDDEAVDSFDPDKQPNRIFDIYY